MKALSHRDESVCKSRSIGLAWKGERKNFMSFLPQDFSHEKENFPNTGKRKNSINRQAKE